MHFSEKSGSVELPFFGKFISEVGQTKTTLFCNNSITVNLKRARSVNGKLGNLSCISLSRC